MEAAALHTNSSDSEEISLDNINVHRLASSITDSEDTSDGSDEDNRPARLEGNKRRKFPPEKQCDNEVTVGIPKGDTNDALVHTSPNANASPKPSDTKGTPVVPPNGENAASPGARAYSPEEESELFSSEYVDRLVASFWTKVDQRIEQAVSHYQGSPQAGQQSNTQDNAQTHDTEAEDKNEEKKSPVPEYPGGICSFIIFIFQCIAQICVLCKDKIQSRGKDWFTHRHTNFTIVMLALIDCFLVVVNIFADFDIIDDNGIEFIFTIFLCINLVVMFLFVLECFLRIIVFRRDLFQEKMEIFDVALVYIYFVVEIISSNGLSEVYNPYPKYLHMIVILRCWRVLPILEQLQLEKEAEISAMESQTPK